jgi:signal transduction histidine kinase
MANAQYTLRQKRRFVLELPISSQECRERWCILSISAVNPDCLREGSIWLLNDISDHKLAEENLRRSEERLRELNESLESQVKVRTEELKKSYESIRQADKMASLGILVAGVAHEINNPISFILLNSSIIQNAWHDVNNLLDAYCRDNDQIWIAGMPYAYAKNGVEKLLKGIHQGAVRVSSIVRNLKEYAKQTPHDMTGVVSINKALTTSLELVRNDLRKATNNLHVEMEPDLPDLRGDLLRIEQVLINLIQNAYQALPERSKAIFIRTYSRNGSICFEITDQGIGISAEDLAHVLDPFFTTKREQGGTGLGLSVSAGIVEEHGGTLRIESVPGQGTCVSLAFPLDVNDGTALRGRNSCPHK